jgi:hypothetical protein
MANASMGWGAASNDWFWDSSQHQAWLGGWRYTGTLARMVEVVARFGSVHGGAGGPVGWLGPYSAPIYNSQGIAVGYQGGIGSNPPWYYGSYGDVPTLGSDPWGFGFYCSGGVYASYSQFQGNSYCRACGICDIASADHNYGYLGYGNGSQVAYGVFFIIEFYQRSGGGWQKRFIAEEISSAGQTQHLLIRRGGGWTQVAELVRRRELDWKREIECLYAPPGERPVHLLGRWDYDHPRYIGFGFPDDKRVPVILPARPYEISFLREAA